MKTLTEINKFKFLEMMAFVNAHKKAWGSIPEKETLFSQFGEIQTKLFFNMMVALDMEKINLRKFVRATLRDDGNIEYKHFHK